MPDNGVERDLYSLGTIVFNIERCVKAGYSLDEPIRIQLSNETFAHSDPSLIKHHLEELLQFVLFKKVEIIFEKEKRLKKVRSVSKQFDSCETICLFSGGADSFSGFLKSHEKYSEVTGVFVAHADQPRIIHLTNTLSEKIKEKTGQNIHTLYAPEMQNRGYSQLRGFLYCLYAGIIANHCNSKRIIMAECGPTMYQPRFSPFDMFTMTTHPYVLSKAKAVCGAVLRRSIDVVIPFEDNTKAEVLSMCPEKTLLPETHSCISQRLVRADGTCYGCVVRRLAAISSGVPDSKYAKDVLLDDSVNLDNLLSLMRYCADILSDPSSMDSYSTYLIRHYKKQDLFKRFSIDNFAAIYQKNKTSKLNPGLLPIFSDVYAQFGPDLFEKRIQELQTNTFQPNFSKKVV